MVETLSNYDQASALLTPEAVKEFISDAFESGDAGYIAHALGIAARAEGMSKISAKTGLAREALYKSFSKNGNPTLKSTIAMMDALGLELTAKPVSTKHQASL